MSPAPSTTAFRQTHPSRISALEGLMHSLSDWCAAGGVPAATVSRLILVLDELFTNIVVHGYQSDPRGDIVVEAELRDKAVDVTLTDHAPPFNPLTVPATDTTLPLEARSLGGLGLLFVRSESDELNYQLENPGAPGASNRLRFTVWFDRSSAAA
jgi:anti-sigma regulatory factor (Ser/Thr protein kinase)